MGRPSAAQVVDTGMWCVQHHGGPQPGKQDTHYIVLRQNKVLLCTTANVQMGTGTPVWGVGVEVSNTLENPSTSTLSKFLTLG